MLRGSLLRRALEQLARLSLGFFVFLWCRVGLMLDIDDGARFLRLPLVAGTEQRNAILVLDDAQVLRAHVRIDRACCYIIVLACHLPLHGLNLLCHLLDLHLCLCKLLITLFEFDMQLGLAFEHFFLRFDECIDLALPKVDISSQASTLNLVVLHQLLHFHLYFLVIIV